VINLPSRTAATMPHPQEQKLQDVVNSLTFDSLNSRVAACSAATSSSPWSASPAPPPMVAFNQSLRLVVIDALGSIELVTLSTARRGTGSVVA
jgi:hypothetical protein